MVTIKATLLYFTNDEVRFSTYLDRLVLLTDLDHKKDAIMTFKKSSSSIYLGRIKVSMSRLK